jgi:hypothetical protein
VPALATVAVLGVLALLPGALAVNARWSAVPFLSAAFWILSWRWVPDLGGGRTRFVIGVAGLSALLGLLRLGREARRPHLPWPVLLVAGAALMRLVPFAWRTVAPGAEMSLHSLEALLLVWHDGVPRTYEPLLPIHQFGAHPPGLHILAGDLALISGVDASRATLLVALMAHGLLVIALAALLRSRLEAPRAALGASLAVSGWAWPQVLFGSGGNAAVLALAFVIAAAAILRRHQRWPSAVAAGLVSAAAIVSEPVTTGVAVGVGIVAMLTIDRQAISTARAGTAVIAGVVVLAPFLLELRASPSVPLPLIFASVGVVPLAFGLAELRRTAFAMAVGAGLACAVSLAAYFLPPGDLIPDDARRATFARLAGETRVTDLVCTDPGTADLWIPALAERGISAPYLPAAYVEEFRQATAGRPCVPLSDRRVSSRR